MSQLPRHLVPPLPQPQKRKGPPLPPLLPPIWEAQLISRQMTPEIPDEQEVEPPTRQMSQLHIKDIVPPNSLPCRKSPGCPMWVTQQASIPTWGQIKMLCHQAQGIASAQGSPTSRESVYCYACLTILPGKRLLPRSKKVLGILPRSSDLSSSYLEQSPYTGPHKPASVIRRIICFLYKG